MRVAKAGYVIMSVIFCVVGVLFIALPERSVLVIGRALGAAMVVFGIIKLVGYFSRDLFRLAFQYDLEFGVLLIALGVISLLRTDGVMDFISIALGVSILADGLFKIQISLDSRRFGIRDWWLILVLAAAAGTAGLLLIFRPWQSVQLMTMVLGASLLAEGILSLCVALSTVKIVDHQQPDVIETDYVEMDGYR